jgi:hypothetical protein
MRYNLGNNVATIPTKMGGLKKIKMAINSYLQPLTTVLT